MNTHKLLFALFHPICEHIIRPVLHCIGYDFEVRERTKSCKDPYKALEPYIETIKNFKCPPQKGETSKIIWQFWWQGEESAPPIVKSCLQSVKRFAGNFKVVVVTQINLSDYIAIPEHIQKKHDARIISHTHFSDYVRVCLLEKYGGIWIDATVYLTGPIPHNILASKFFIFRSPSWTLSNHCALSLETLPTFCKVSSGQGGGYTVGSNWFIAASTTAVTPSLLKHLLEIYWEKVDFMIDYFILHILMTLSATVNERSKTEFLDMPYYDNLKPHLLQALLTGNYNPKLVNSIKGMTFVHKLTYKFDSATIGPDSNASRIITNSF